MNEILVQHPSHPNATISFPEDDGNPNHLSRRERDHIIEQTRSELGDERLHASRYIWGDSTLDFDALLRGSSRDIETVRNLTGAWQENGTSGNFLSNIRALRNPILPFHWEQNGVVVNSTPNDLMEGPRVILSQPNDVAWEVQAQIQIPEGTTARILENGDMEGVEILSFNQEENTLQLHVRMTAPRMCQYGVRSRTFFEIPIELQNPHGVETMRVPLDQQCLLGDYLGVDEYTTARLTAYSHRPSPIVEEIGQGIRHDFETAGSPLNVGAVWEALQSSIRFRGGRYVRDPMVVEGFYSAGSGYVLRPEETIRYGGDCEDWAILVTGVFRYLGFEAYTRDLGMHSTTDVRGRDGRYHEFDLTQGVVRALTTEQINP